MPEPTLPGTGTFVSVGRNVSVVLPNCTARTRPRSFEESLVADGVGPTSVPPIWSQYHCAAAAGSETLSRTPRNSAAACATTPADSTTHAAAEPTTVLRCQTRIDRSPLRLAIGSNITFPISSLFPRRRDAQ